MFTINKKTNLLEKAGTVYVLNDVKEPELYRDFFSYEEVPKIVFNHRLMPINMPDNIYITDTTFRDGQQSRAPYTVEQIVKIFTLLHKLGGPNGIIRQSEFFVYSEKDRRALGKCRELGLKFPEVTSWIRSSKKDFELVKQLEIKETGLLVSCSDYHIFLKMNMTRKQAMEHYLGVVRQCIETGIKPRCHLEDITRADFYGFVVPFAEELKKLSDDSGVPVKLRACDTMGYGVTHPGAVMPRSVHGIIHGLNQHAGFPSELLEWHGHNDFYRAVSNASDAWLFGCGAVNCSVLGIGERTGNTPLEAMVFEYAQLRGSTDGMDTRVVTELAEYFEKELGYEIPPMTPFVGKNFNVTRAGIHADGLLKNEEIYNIFDTELLLRRPPKTAVSATSGAAGIAHSLSGLLGLKDKKALDKRDPAIETIKAWVDAEYATGRVTSITDEELLAQYKKSKK
jgi:isopropylmalate/homocitrate/citramalate synthase